MNKEFRKILAWAVALITIPLFGYALFVVYSIYSFAGYGGCGMDDGPFKGKLIEKVDISESAQNFKLKNNGELILENRVDSLSPILTLIENGKVKWTIDTDVRNTKGFENYRIWKISNLTITEDSDHINLSFTGHWTFGAEHGSMEIDRDDGDNSFCLSW